VAHPKTAHRLIPARRRWGQHFLASDAIAERIVNAARVGEGDTVIEIGPGEGALTRILAPRARRLVAIEIDPARARLLASEFAGEPRVRILEGDALARSYAAWLESAGFEGPAVLLGNLPYNAATPILHAAIEEPTAIRRAVATVQREVARRFAARPGDESFGYLSVRTAAFASARILFDLPPGAFRPRPKVTSSVLELSPRPLDPAAAARRERALSLASLGFRARRKTLANALASAGPRAAWEAALERIGHSARARAEELSFEDYVALAAEPRTPR
jgi:16S rRNA (adenine1518-N6/adenine1519-N6)-dimethyltransferase